MRTQAGEVVTGVNRLAEELARFGLPALAWRLRRRGEQGRGVVLMYHQIADEADFPEHPVPPAVFERHITLLRKRIQVVPLLDLLKRLKEPHPMSEDIAAITFDDGFRDNLDNALPILKRHGLPATVFVTTGFVDGTTRPASERLRDAFRILWQECNPNIWPAKDGRVNRLVRAALVSPGSRAAVRRLHLELKKIPHAESESVIDKVEQLAGTPKTHSSRTLDWEGVRTLAEQGIEIASHTVSHPVLSRVPLDHAEHELRTSKEQLEAKTGRSVLGFAYPNGHTEDFEAEHIDLLQSIGYAYACTAEWGGNWSGCDPFRLRRIGIGCDSDALLDFKLALAGSVQRCAAS